MVRKLSLCAVVFATMIGVSASTAEAASVRARGTVAAAGPCRAGAAHGHAAVYGVGVGRPGGTVVARGTAVGAHGAAHKSVRVHY
jgi:hypothetical protein